MWLSPELEYFCWYYQWLNCSGSQIVTRIPLSLVIIIIELAVQMIIVLPMMLNQCEKLDQIKNLFSESYVDLIVSAGKYFIFRFQGTFLRSCLSLFWEWIFFKNDVRIVTVSLLTMLSSPKTPCSFLKFTVSESV